MADKKGTGRMGRKGRVGRGIERSSRRPTRNVQRSILKVCVAWACSLFLGSAAFAVNVVYDGRTSAEFREWADRCYLREQMEAIAPKICQALYGDTDRARHHENVTITLYIRQAGGNPAFAAGKRITWNVKRGPTGDASGGIGCLTHEMAHVLDMGSDRVFTEAMADWVRYYNCTPKPRVLDYRYSALRGKRGYGKYMSGANFIDFMTQNYGEGTIYKILLGYREHGKDPWRKLFGKEFDGLLAEWRQMQTIYDPVFQWSYNGTEAGCVRKDKSFCGLGALSVKDTADQSGAWLAGATSGKVNHLSDGNMTLALHGWFPSGGKALAIASLGAAQTGNGKAVLLATAFKPDTLAAHVLASPPGGSCGIVSTTAIPVPGLAARPHSLIVTVRGGNKAAVMVDGKPAAMIDLETKCGGCVFPPAFAVGGMEGGIGLQGISEPNGKGGIRLDDLRVFNRTFRGRETADYAATFNDRFRPAVAVTAEWRGAPGGGGLDNPDNWYCVNALGEKVVALPTKETAVKVAGKRLPCIPPGSGFVCQSFTIDGWAVVEEANIDLRGVTIVDLADNTRIITKGGHGLAVSSLRASRMRLDGMLAVTTAMKVAGNVELKEGSALRLPADAGKAQVKSLSIKGDGAVALKPGTLPKRGESRKMLRVETLPDDLSRFRLNLSQESDDAVYTRSADGRFLTIRLKD